MLPCRVCKRCQRNGFKDRGGSCSRVGEAINRCVSLKKTDRSLSLAKLTS